MVNFYPSYPKKLTLLAARVVLDGVLGRRRSFREDAIRLIAQLRPALRTGGVVHLPGGGPGLVICNHYYRPGFDAWWIPFAISASTTSEIHWVTTRERRFASPLVRLLEKRFLAWVGQVYTFFPMPAMPPRPEEARQRAQVVGRVVEFVRRSPAPLVGLAPEGRDSPAGALDWPPPGGGRFMLELNRLGLPIFPVGIYEQDGHLCLQAGPAFSFPAPPGLRSKALDRWAARQAMQALAGLLPGRLRGEFGKG